MNNTRTPTPAQIDLLVQLEKYSDMFYEGTLTFDHRVHAYTAFHDLFPEQFNNMFSPFTQDRSRIDKDSQVIIFHPMFGGWDSEGREGEFYSIWDDHILQKGLASIHD